VQLGEDYLFLKLYGHQSRFKIALQSMGMGSALRAYKSARLLRREGVAVPKPRGCLLLPEGLMLVVEGIHCIGNMREVWLNKPPDAQLHGMMAAAGQALAQLHMVGYAHGNCRWINLLWDGQAICFVDLDTVSKASLGCSKQARDLARFTITAEELEIGPVLFDTFLESYRQVVGDSRHAIVERMAYHLYGLRAIHHGGSVRHGQRLI
jgi:tRNA A-37 threonylcarbamoyl transferase component Bud32